MVLSFDAMVFFRHFLALFCLGLGCRAPQREGESPEPPYDLLIRGGDLYDGAGGPAVRGDVAIRGDRIARIGDLRGAAAARVIEAKGQAVAPGFINMLSIK
ncbi:MAG: hypothetical protein HY717_06825 [Planctomycetes bacterium]|nr:hypothetical protein [Planctomycetota bacterium]